MHDPRRASWTIPLTTPPLFLCYLLLIKGPEFSVGPTTRRRPPSRVGFGGAASVGAFLEKTTRRTSMAGGKPPSTTKTSNVGPSKTSPPHAPTNTPLTVAAMIEAAER
ncbi:hypothetical protein K523DRAFT_25703 [Schizophyllum commune Tattone D]|nr:hypothetical protein K523DRAFT_25703 [Schizophyllum commune Tattone D]